MGENKIQDEHLYATYPNKAHCHKTHKRDVILLSNTIVQPLNKRKEVDDNEYLKNLTVKEEK